MHIKKYILLLASVLLVVACSNDDFTHQEPIQDGPVKVGFWMGRGDSENTRTFINDDGQTISWEAEDKVALWAQKDNVYTFQNKTFDTWFVAAETNQAFFTTTLPEAMPEGPYTYYACYPLPQSVSGTTATFTLPSTQDGKMGGGADIMVAQGTGPALEKLYTPADPNNSEVVPDYIIEDGLTLNMHHLIHALRFYVPAGKWGFPTGETVERIVFTMPANVAGTVTADVSNTNGLTLTSGGTNTISLNLKEPIGASTADNGGNITYDYAVAAILPPSTNYESNDKLVVKTYSQSRVAKQEISLNGRGPQAADEKMRMAAGRVTPVGLNCLTVTERPKISFRIASNNLGEQPYKITLTSADTNTKWKAGDDHEYEYYTGSDNSTIAVGSGFDIYYDEDVLSTISGKSVTVTYESKSAIVTETITMPTMSVGTSYSIDLNVPWLFAENFDGWDSITNHWEEKENSASWINGWSGNQWRTNGNNMGLCSYTGDYGYYNGIFIKNSFYATDTYFGRLDSPSLPLKVGKNVKILIKFEVSLEDGANNGYASCVYGYSTSEEAIVGGYTPYIGSLVNGLEGAGTDVAKARAAMTRNLPSTIVAEVSSNGEAITQFDISNTSNNIRLTWFTEINNNHKERISSKWFYSYIDNIKVQIVSE
ncbi:MAG: hypothetical protein IJ378_05200 [Alistipes sp.]|nr:hypothetical protein [Alistipes sp.]